MGTNLAGLIAAAEKLGFNARAFKGEIADKTLDAKAAFPFIAHIKITYLDNTYDHFVVIKAIRGLTWTKTNPIAFCTGTMQTTYIRTLNLMAGNTKPQKRRPMPPRNAILMYCGYYCNYYKKVDIFF
jgi:ABC-type bacteriocin/lantibiotic exporter with double-glycine peptidase domain